MKYEQEIIQLIPMIKSYIHKISRGYRNDVDDIMQECMINALSVDRDDLRNPRNYLIGVCARTISTHYRRDINRKKIEQKYCEYRDHGDEIENISVLECMESRVKRSTPKCRRVWSALKFTDGDTGTTAAMLGVHVETVRLIRRELKAMYREECSK